MLNEVNMFILAHNEALLKVAGSILLLWEVNALLVQSKRSRTQDSRGLDTSRVGESILAMDG